MSFSENEGYLECAGRSHRVDFEDCKWWKKSNLKGSVPLSDVDYKINPEGVFRGRETSSDQSLGGGSYQYSLKKNGDFVSNSVFVTITTQDDVSGIEVNDIVSFGGFLWRVAYPIRRSKNRKMDMFVRSNVFTYYIDLIR